MRLLEKTPLLWQQLDGPQANGVIEGGRKWFLEWASVPLDYFDKLNLTTANSQHLDFIGNLMGIARPLVIMPDYFAEMFKYTRTPQGQGITWGYGNLPKNDQGGWIDFRNPLDRPGVSMVGLPDEMYRRLLRIVGEDPDIGTNSHIFLDRVCAEFSNSYEINNAYGKYAGAMPDDIEVRLTEYSSRAYVTIESIANQFISPFPRVFMDMVDEGPQP